MKNCLTCGALVADDADVCPDCGMELDTNAPAPPPQSAPVQGNDDGAGFTVDFGDNAEAAPAQTDEADDVFGDDPFSFAPAEPAVSLEKETDFTESAPPAAPTPAAPATMQPGNSAQITLKRGGALTDEVFPFGPGAIVGRFDPDSGPVDVDLAPLPEASYVSRHHVEFRFDGGQNQWFVQDMGSRNGTFWRAGGQGSFARLSGEQVLETGDEIALGNARFVFQTH